MTWEVERFSGSAGGTDDKTYWNGRIVTNGKSLDDVQNMIEALPDLIKAANAVLLFVNPSRSSAAAMNALYRAVKKADGE